MNAGREGAFALFEQASLCVFGTFDSFKQQAMSGLLVLHGISSIRLAQTLKPMTSSSCRRSLAQLASGSLSHPTPRQTLVLRWRPTGQSRSRPSPQAMPLGNPTEESHPIHPWMTPSLSHAHRAALSNNYSRSAGSMAERLTTISPSRVR